MKHVATIVIILTILTTSAFAGGQKISAIAESSDWLGLEFTYRDLNLKSETLDDSINSLMIGLLYKDVSEDFSHNEHLGYINWDGNNDDFGIYFNLNVSYRFEIPFNSETQNIFIAVGAISGFELGFYDADKYVFSEVGLALSVGYQIPLSGFSVYAGGFYEYIFISKTGDIELNYESNPPWALQIGVEYTPPKTIFNFGIEATFFRETTITAFFALNI